MSYDISLVDDNGEIMKCDLQHKLTGGKVLVNEDMEQIATVDAELNITYNYGTQYKTLWESGSLYDFEGMRAKEIIPILKHAISILGTDTADDYWSSTPGNAGKALDNLLFLCEQCPEGVVEIC